MKTLLLSILLLPCICNAQTRIGNITISDTTAKKYFIDCYSHPDTVRPKSTHDFLSCTLCLISNEEAQRAKVMADDFNETLKKYNIGEARDTTYYEAYNDTLYDGILSALSGSKKAKKITIEHKDAGYYVDWKGYLMPRKPSEQDFIKWFNKFNNQ